VPGTVGATLPFWSPDGRSLGFFADDALKRVNLAGGSPQVLAPTPAVPLGATWSPKDVIVFSARSVLYKVPAAGGPVEEVAAINRDFREDSLRFPRILPGGERFLYVARSGNRADSAVYVGGLDGPSTRLFPVSSQVEYSPPGYLLYVRNETLVARTFDPETLTVGSETVAVAEGVGTLPTSIVAFFALSPNGPLLYQGNTPQTSVLQWFDRSGRPLRTISSKGLYPQFRLGPDGRRVALSFDDDRDGRSSVWTLESDRQVLTRLTFAATHDRDPIWSPDGQRIVFSSSRRGSYAMYVKAAAGSGTEEELLRSDDDLWPEDWSADGRFVAYRRARATTSTDVMLLPLSADRTPIPVAESPASEHGARFSPNSRWIAYVSAETGREEIFVEPVPPTGATWQVSTEGGYEPTWRGDGRELFYQRPDGTLVSVEVTDNGAAFAWGPPGPLFRAGPPTALTGRYEVSRDGQSILVAVPAEPARPRPMMVVLNWLEELKQRLPPGSSK
jgi:Tol biopolymer transport system component